MTGLLEEMAAAGRGMIALLTGQRDAHSYFLLTPAGLAGSLVAFLVAGALSAYLPPMLGVAGTEQAQIASWQVFFTSLFFYATQIGFSGLVLSQMRRLDGFLPYLVADNWASFYATLISLGLTLAGIPADVAVFILLIPIIVIEVNIARLIVTLTVMQIVMFLVAQLIAVFVAMLVLSALFPNFALAQ